MPWTFFLSQLFSRPGGAVDRGAQWHPAHLETIRCLMSVIDAGTPLTRGLSSRVAKLSLDLAEELCLPPDTCIDLEYAALLHDIGRTAIHRDLILRPGPLDEEERNVVRTHPQVGYEILKELPLLERVAGIVLAHHEQPDGRGYPDGLTGDRIPVEARIISVAAAFDALAVDRPYRRGLGIDGAMSEIRRCSGSQFSSEVVEALERLHRAGRLKLENGEETLPGTTPDRRAA